MRHFKTYLILSTALLFLLSLGKVFHETMHEWGGSIGSSANQLIVKKQSPEETTHTRLQELEVENHLLSEMVSQLKEEFQQDRLLTHQMERFLEISGQPITDYATSARIKQQASDLGKRIDTQMRFIRAQVVFREPSTWGSYCWIDRGYQSSEGVLAMNSPVVIGENIVGVVDYVGRNKSRVQLVTDARLPIAVQVHRGYEKNLPLVQKLVSVFEEIDSRDDLNLLPEEKEGVLVTFQNLLERFKKETRADRLARGEIFGFSHSLFRKPSSQLKGIGFHCQASEVGRALDKTDAIEPGDLLVTTGMDGIFPRGFHAAIVEKIDPIREGDIAIDIEARTTVEHLDELRYVEVLPPIRVDDDFDLRTM